MDWVAARDAVRALSVYRGDVGSRRQIKHLRGMHMNTKSRSFLRVSIFACGMVATY